MKSYGHNRRDKLECKYGCCKMKRGNNMSEHRSRSDRSRRKTARQEAEKGIFTSLFE